MVERRLRPRHILVLFLLILIVYFSVRSLMNIPQASLSTKASSTSQSTTSTVPEKPLQEPVSNPDPLTLPPDQAKIHVVISHYEEEPYWIGTWLEDLRSMPIIQQLGLHVTIYTKGTIHAPSHIQSSTGASMVIPLPNIGREGSTYLHHILTNWDHLPPYTLFTQSYLKKAQQSSGTETGHFTPWLTERISNNFNTSIGFMSLDRKHDICHCGHCTDMPASRWWPSSAKADTFYPLWPQLFTLITGQVCSSSSSSSSSQQSDLSASSSSSSSPPTLLSFNAHFIVSRRRIHARPKSIYTYLRDLVDAPLDHWIHREREPAWFDRQKGASEPSNPKFGHTLERLWHTIFACDDPAKVVDCDVEGLKEEGKGGCSCLDDEERENGAESGDVGEGVAGTGPVGSVPLSSDSAAVVVAGG